jgi:O-antigen biosynthesis protein
MTDPACSIVVCTRHRAELLTRCLRSLTELDYPTYELIVVDNTVGDPEVEQQAAGFDARYVVESRTGLSRARNAGARAARGEIIAYTDDDAVAERDWLRKHAAALQDPTLGATTGRILPTSLDTPAARRYAAAGGENLGDVAFRVDQDTPAWFEMANFGGVGAGANIALRRTLFEGGWGFRESLGPGARIPGEEHYAFFAIIRAGHGIAYVPGAIVYHDYPRTPSALARRRSRILRGTVAYMAMLLVEEPEFRRDTLRYMWEAARGNRRGWRRGDTDRRLGNRLQLAGAVGTGVPLYLWSLITSRDQAEGAPLPAPAADPERHRPSAPS